MRGSSPNRLASGADKIELSPDGLRINGTLVIRQVGPFYLPLLKQAQTDDESANRLARIGRLLTGGDIYSALIYASTTRWSPFDEGSQRYAKANFNPFEARDYRGWWTRFDSDPGSADAKITEVGYNGFFHDVFVDKFIDDLRKIGATAEKNITVVAISGVSSIPDIIALPVGAKLPRVIEIKTGANPPYTENQGYVYPLLCIGGHVTSFDPRLPSLGLAVGKPFPPLEVDELWTPGPGQPIEAKDVCAYLGLRP